MVIAAQIFFVSFFSVNSAVKPVFTLLLIDVTTAFVVEFLYHAFFVINVTDTPVTQDQAFPGTVTFVVRVLAHIFFALVAADAFVLVKFALLAVYMTNAHVLLALASGGVESAKTLVVKAL